MHGLTLRQIRAFLVTVELGSVAAAARNLGLTQPAVGQQLRELEGQLRVRLFEKVGTRLHPTPAGQALLEPAREVMAALTHLQETGTRFRAGDAGHIRLGTGATACIYFLPERLRRVRQSLPGVEIAVSTGNTAPMLQALMEGTLDAALVTGGPDEVPTSLVAELLFHDPLMALLPHPLADALPETLSPADLAAHPLLLHARGSVTRNLVDRWFQEGGHGVVPGMEFDSIAAIRELVAAGLGCAIVPGMAARVPHPELVARPLSPALTRPICLVLRANQVPDAALRLLAAELRAAKP
ncbi:LysR family transcriptional regulator [Rhodovarius crocodyli]|uniref:LysR family transcriptional regulator n=1 Tax=Rhodovarius crocodyli TaxID=1979269 RepID=A0A437M336_9PROT|nr:LysR family transcriptional regulator [Rhodovarius crocodyli]RVT91996.1 LysR family transcriptional regulator [Rhodovarius crocodyli]